jgi:hypothetical protein
MKISGRGIYTLPNKKTRFIISGHFHKGSDYPKELDLRNGIRYFCRIMMQWLIKHREIIYPNETFDNLYPPVARCNTIGQK